MPCSFGLAKLKQKRFNEMFSLCYICGGHTVWVGAVVCKAAQTTTLSVCSKWVPVHNYMGAGSRTVYPS